MASDNSYEQATMDSTLVLQLDPTPGNARNSEGAFITLKDGRILFVWSKYTANDGTDHGPCVIACRFSSDGGRTWSDDERVLAEPKDGAQNLMSVSLIRLQGNPDRIVLLYARKEGNFSREEGKYVLGPQCRPLVQFSDDEMATLSEPVYLTPSIDYHVVNNDRIIQLTDGTLVVPVAHHRFGLPPVLDGTGGVEFKEGATIFFFLSHDGGQTWTESRNSFYRCFPDGSGLQEPGAMQLKDGRVWAWARTAWLNGEKSARQWQSFSEDNGLTWSEPEPSVFCSPCSPLSMKRIPSTGDLLAVWDDHSGRYPLPEKTWRRTPMVSAISRDEGVTWEHHRLWEDEPLHGYCYTAIHFVEDAVLLAYCAGNIETTGQLRRLRMRRIPLSEFYAGD